MQPLFEIGRGARARDSHRLEADSRVSRFGAKRDLQRNGQNTPLLSRQRHRSSQPGANSTPMACSSDHADARAGSPSNGCVVRRRRRRSSAKGRYPVQEPRAGGHGAAGNFEDFEKVLGHVRVGSFRRSRYAVPRICGCVQRRSAPVDHSVSPQPRRAIT
jgi:hypothetical protein